MPEKVSNRGGKPPRDSIRDAGEATAGNARRQGRVSGRTLGPVSDLERHLPAEWWRTLFNAVYLQTDGDVVENQANTARDVDTLICAAGLTADDAILDLCCGQGRHVLELARRGFKHVAGIDRSRYLVRLARRRAAREGLKATFHEGDARKFRFPESSRRCVTILGNSFGYFDREEDDALVLAAVKRVLKSGGTLVMDITDGEWMKEHFEPRSWEWLDQNHFVCRERSLAADGERLISREVVTHAERGVIADQFYAERLYSRDRIAALIEGAGFTDVRFHEDVGTESSRNQDLGMMAKRLFLTAQAPTKVAAARPGLPPYPDVTVLMGDPRLPDAVKRDGRFNAEDLETVARMKEALAALEGYRFRYHDNHVSLIQALRSDPPAFVLNLCDEGYNNEAVKELHVPAYLEMLGIPYSGGGPTCLGLCYDKSLVRSIAQAMEVPVPLETFFDASDHAATIPAIFPALIKPSLGDSSIGITRNAVVSTAEEAVAYINEVRTTLPGQPLLIQEFLAGAEYSVGLIGNPGAGFNALPVLEVDYGALDEGLPRILAYESKWVPDSPYWTKIRYREADLEEMRRREMVDQSIQLFERLGCRDYARFDFRADAEGTVKLLEVNPNPGWCWDGKFNLMAEFAGMTYAELLAAILETAEARAWAERGAAAKTAA